MRKLFIAVVATAWLLPTTSVRASELTLSMDGGLVTLIAKDAPLSAVLAEWARVGKTTIVNGDRLLTPVTLHLEGVPEKKALDIVLRAAAGYMVAERAVSVAGASVFDRIMILPTSRPPANSPVFQAAPQPFAPPRPMPMPMPMPVDDDDNGTIQPPTVVPNQPNAQPGVPQQTGPQGPLTSPRPGQLPAPPPQQPVPFGAPRPGVPAPNQPVKPGGGGEGGY